MDGTPNFVLGHKLKELKGDLKKLNDTEFRHLNLQKKQLLAELGEIDAMEDSRLPTIEEKGKRETLIVELDKVLMMDEICWRQKSRVLWLKEGDQNSKFFHRLASSHRSNNTIGKLLINGVPSTCQDEIRDHIALFYEQLYMEDGYHRPSLDGVDFTSNTAEDAVWLDRPFEEMEIEDVVRGCNGDKAPGSDGFSLAFFQHCWSSVRNDILAVSGIS